MGKKRGSKQIDAICQEFGIDGPLRKEFGRFIATEKESGYGGSQNQKGDFTCEELRQKMREWLGIDDV